MVGDARMSLRDPSGQSHEILDSVLYLRGGMIDSVGYGNGVGQKYGYDSTRPLLRSMVSTKSGSTLHRLEMTYDDEGNVQTQTRPNGENALFEYDGLYRLKLVRYPTDQSGKGSLQYRYDLNRNRLGFVHEFGDATWSYRPGTNLLNSGTSSSEGFRKYGWDRRGNLSTETRWGADPGVGTDNFIERRQMSWNVRNELERAVVVRRGAEGYDSTVVGMLYGEDGNRVLKAVVDSVSGTDTTWRVTNRWVYDGTAVVADSGASGPGWTWHAYNGLSRVAELSGDTARVRFLLTDHLGTVQAILDDTGAVVGRYQLDPYGNLEGYQGSASTALLYTGKGFDADVGAWYFNARFYDAERGSFIGRDPKLEYFSPYLYTGNMPLTVIDLDGNAAISYDGNPEQVDMTRASVALLQTTPRGAEIIDIIECHDVPVAIQPVVTNGVTEQWPRFEPDAGVVKYDPYSKIYAATDAGLLEVPPVIQIGHELGHAADMIQGLVDLNGYKSDKSIKNEIEIGNIHRNENPIRKSLGIPLRLESERGLKIYFR